MDTNEVDQPGVEVIERKPKEGKWWHGTIGGGVIGMLLLLNSTIDIIKYRPIPDSNEILIGGLGILTSLGLGSVGGWRFARIQGSTWSTAVLGGVLAIVIPLAIGFGILFFLGFLRTFGII